MLFHLCEAYEVCATGVNNVSGDITVVMMIP
jgi:hypothetical protein